MNSYTRKPPNIILCVSGGHRGEDASMTLTMHACSTIEEWIDTFKLILNYQDFDAGTIARIFDEIDESQSDDEEETETPQFLRERSEF